MKLMKISSRAQRMQHFKKLHGRAGLNLVSLMDIFTILVFFLLVSSSDVQQLPNNKKISLPTSIAEKAPKETIVIAITKTAILVQGVEVAKLDDVLQNPAPEIARLEQELKFHSSKSVNLRQPGAGRSRKTPTAAGGGWSPHRFPIKPFRRK